MSRPGAIAGGWLLDEIVADAATVHARPVPDDGRRHLTIVRPTSTAVVLGSAQRDVDVDTARTGVAAARRHGGGGAVWVAPDVAWFELFVPAGDPLWEVDVGRAFVFAGEAVAEILDLGDAEVHTAALRLGRWGGLVCFAGLGPGEVTVGGRKLVGWTQRRTRAGSRFSGLIYPRWDPEPLLDALVLHADVRRRAAAGTGGVGIGSLEVGLGGADEVLDAIGAALAGS